MTLLELQRQAQGPLLRQSARNKDHELMSPEGGFERRLTLIVEQTASNCRRDCSDLALEHEGCRRH
jgi:hypothetical protein